MEDRREALTKSLVCLLETHVPNLYKIWNECGWDRVFMERREREVKENVETLLLDMVKEEEDNKQEIINHIEKYLQEVAKLRSELGVVISVDGMEDLPLYEVEQLLKKRVQEVLKVKEARLARYHELKRREMELCTALGIKEYPLLPAVPAEEDLNVFQHYVEEKNEEKDRLMKVYTETKSKILSILNELELQPVTDFEKMVVFEKDCKFLLHKENMTRLKDLHVSYEHQLEEAKALSVELRERLSNLWERLQESYEYREHFLNSYPGFTSNTIKALKREILKCEEKKRLNIKEFVARIREELSDWWDQCYIGEEQRRAFKPFYTDTFTEDVLEQHEAEVQKLTKYYNVNVDIIALIKEHQNLWQKMLAMENREHDKDRLFQNRGGQLLREEKERKKLQKKLPTIEEELKKYVAAYTEREGKPFMYYDECILKYMERQWHEYRVNKEQEKQARKKGKEAQDSASKTNIRTVSSSKRKIIGGSTPNQRTSKMRKVDENKPTAEFPRVTKRKVVRKIFEGNRQHQQNFVPLSHGLDASLGASVASTYTDFQDHLEKLNKETPCRSSVRCLKERNVVDSPNRPTARKEICDQNMLTPSKPPRKNLTTPSHATKSPHPFTPQSTSRVRIGTPGSASKRGLGSAAVLSTPHNRPPLII